MKKKKGFTLVELIAVIAISAVFGAIVLAISLTTGKLFNMAQTDSVYNDKSRVIISTIEDDLRTASNIVGTTTPLVQVNEVVIGTDHYSFDSPAKVILSFKKTNGDVYAYKYIEPNLSTGSTGELIRMKYDNSIGVKVFKPISTGFIDISDVSIKKNIVATDNKRYTIILKFDGSTEYSAVITPRN